ncbi:hypothetical protein HY792_07155 [Candidatus Desantisbacteria bacterium]|nr:hypothetical protein [Candidatus Desantisbacteria bacterium]
MAYRKDADRHKGRRKVTVHGLQLSVYGYKRTEDRYPKCFNRVRSDPIYGVAQARCFWNAAAYLLPLLTKAQEKSESK